MKQIKKLARRGMARIFVLLATILFAVTFVLGLIMLGEGAEQVLMSSVILLIIPVSYTHLASTSPAWRSCRKRCWNGPAIC